jgi:hypothetical protein
MQQPEPGHASGDEPAERFCPKCGRSCTPLKVPHLSVDCKDCGRTVYFLRLDPSGEGIRIEAGERLTIPAGFIKMSLQPSPTSHLARPGLGFLLNQLFVGTVPSEEGIYEFVDQLQKIFDTHIEAADAAQGLNLETEAGLEELVKRLEERKLSIDWYMLSAAMFCGGLKWSIENDRVKRAAWTGYMLGTFRGLTIVSEPLFEETLWRGYLANEVIYEAAAAASGNSPAEIEALKRLQPLFRQFDEGTLHALVESGLPIGPKIKVKNLPEELLRALAKFQLATIEREREEKRLADKEAREEERGRRKDKRDDTELRIKWLSSGVAIGGLVVAVIGLVAKAI